ncbi:MAG: hypothetical protein CM15mP102_08240 [Flavobacteriales bacterium]|nr:MAG: hypothetical protein CM15mP102_08240 [Flavobacteriales bacterium]
MSIVKHVNPTISKLAKEFHSDEIKFIAISSNDVINYPEDSPEKMKINAVKNDFTFPYLYDESQEVARAYDAACTPDFYVYDSNLKLVYRGQLDDSRPGNEIESMVMILGIHSMSLNGIENQDLQKPSIGCNIKWK